MNQQTNISQLIIKIHEAGFIIAVNADKLSCIPMFNTVLPEELRAKIKKEKSQIIDYLATQNNTLSDGQSRMLYISQFSSEPQAYNVPVIINIFGELNYQKLSDSLNLILVQNIILRTKYQSFNDHYSAVVETNRLILKPEEVTKKTLNDKLRIELKRPFRLNCELPVRFKLYKISENEHVLLLNFHHICHDGWSLETFFNLLENYYIDRKVVPSILQYNDYARWLNNYKHTTAYQKSVQYWQKRLEGSQPNILPSDTNGLFKRDHEKCKCIPFELDTNIAIQIINTAKKLGSTPFICLLSLFNLLLSHYVNSKEIVIAVPISNRPMLYLKDLIGYISNTIFVKQIVTTHQSIDNFIKQLHVDFMSDLENGMVDITDIKECNFGTDKFPCIFSYHKFDFLSKSLNFGTATGNIELLFNGANKANLLINIVENNNLFSGQIEYDTELYSETLITNFLKNFISLAKQFFSDTDRTLNQLLIINPEERLLLEKLSHSNSNRKNPALLNLFGQHVNNFPNSVCLQDEKHSFSYIETDIKTNQVANYLFNREKTELTHVSCSANIIAIDIADALDFVLLCLAVIKLGYAYMPLDTKQSEIFLTEQLKKAKPKIIILKNKLIINDDSWKYITISKDEIFCNLTDSSALRSIASIDQLAYVMFTSGTTGNPKGVSVTQKNIVDLVYNTNYFKPKNNDKMAQFSNLAFDGATFEIWGALLNGLPIVFICKDLQNNPFALEEYLNNFEVSIAFVTTAYFLQAISVNPRAFSNINCLYVGGEYMPASIYQTLLANGFDKKTIYNIYGPTECVTFSTYYSYLFNGQIPKIVPIGKPISNRYCQIMDEAGNILPYGAIGELCIAGSIAEGYLNLSALTSERFVSAESLQLDQKIFYRTGDLAQFTHTNDIVLHGRNDRQVKHRGYRIELDAINQIIGQVSDIQQSLLYFHKKENDPTMLIAFLILCQKDNEQTEELAEIKLELQKFLPRYMQPDVIIIVNEYPLTKNGKVDFSKLISLYDTKITSVKSNISPINTSTELTNMWSYYLGHSQFNSNSSFFEVGGDSLNLLRLLNNIKNTLCKNISLRDLFQAKTFQEMAEKIDSAKTLSHKLSFQYPEQKLLNPSQQSLWFLDNFSSINGLYHIPLALQISGKVDSTSLEMALTKFIQRHSICQTTIITKDGKPYHEQIATSNKLLEIIDYSKNPLSETQIKDKINALTNIKFIFGQERLIRAYLIINDESEHILLLVFHHIIADGWSMTVALNELTLLYQKQDHLLPNLPTSYFNYNAYLNHFDKSESGNAAKKYWYRHLKDAPDSNKLPYSKVKNHSIEYTGNQFSFELTKDQIALIDQLAKNINSSRIVVLLGIYQLLLYLLTKQSIIITGTPLANRKLTHSELLVGYFANTTPIKSYIDLQSSLYDFLQSLQNTILNAEEHSLPFETIVETLNIKNTPGESPIFQTWFYTYNLNDFKLNIPNLNTNLIPFSTSTAKYDLTMAVIFDGNNISINFEYASTRFIEEDIRQFSGKFTNLINTFSNNDISLQDYLYPKTGLQQNRNLLTVLCDQVKLKSDCVAIIDNTNVLTYQQFYNFIVHIAKELAQRNVGYNDVVATLLPNCIQALGVFYATMLIGAIYAPIDLQQPQERINTIFENLSPQVVITENDIALFNQLMLVSINEDNKHVLYPEPLESKQEIAYIIHTSGSTGVPKAVACYHASVLNFLDSVNELAPLTPLIVGTVWTQFTFDVSIYEVCHILCTGGSLQILSNKIRLDSEAFFRILEEHKITSTYIPPFLLALFLRYLEQHNHSFILQRLLIGVEPISEALIYKIQSHLPNTVIINGYGPTETTIACTLYRVPFQKPKHELQAKIPIGHPVKNSHCYILNENFMPTADQEIGEIVISGKALAWGYWQQNELTDKNFTYISTPFLERAYRTGDLAKRNTDNNIEFIGRRDSQIKIRGYRIELMEIQNALYELPYVKEAVVLILNHKPNSKIIAFIVSTDTTISDDIVKNALSIKLPTYMLPQLITFVDAIPLTSHGKIDSKKLENQVVNKQSLRLNLNKQLDNYQATMLQIWQEILSNLNITITDRLFDIGGDSIIAMQIVSYAKEKGIIIELKQLFNNPNILELSESTSENSEEIMGPLMSQYPTTPIQAWFFEQGFLNPQNVTQSLLLEFNNPVDDIKLLDCVDAVLKRHPIFSMVFRADVNNNWHAEQSFDLHQNNPINKEIKIVVNFDEIKKIYYKTKETINYTTCPLITYRLIYNSVTHKKHLLLVAHHLIIDVVSWQILLRDTFKIYSGTLNRDSIQTPNFSQYANKIHETSFRNKIQEELLFWYQQAILPSLPIYRDVESLPCVQSVIIDLAMPSNTISSLQDFIVTSVVATLANVFTTNVVKLAFESHGRHISFLNYDFSEAVGWFTNIYPLSFDINQNASLFDLHDTISFTLKSVQNSGLGYSYLKYIEKNTLLCSASKDNEPNVLFNYLGKLNTQFTYQDISAKMISIDGEFNADLTQMKFPLEIISYHQDNSLIIRILYDKNVITESLANLISTKLHYYWTSLFTTEPYYKNQLTIEKNNLVQLREGVTTPLFFLHPIGGEIYWYHPLVSLLDSDFIIYGIRSPSFVKEKHYQISIEQLAEHYLAQIHSKIIHNKCVIIGWSFGAILSFEITKRLEALGVVVSFFALDQPLVHNNGIFTKKSYSLKIADNEIEINLSQLQKLKPKKYFDTMIKDLLASADFHDVVINQLVLLDALLHYHFTGEILNSHLIISSETAKFADKNIFFGWKEYLRKNPMIDIITGDHYSMLQSHNIHQLASIINKKNIFIDDSLAILQDLQL